MMRVAIMQPYFFPYIGYFQLINAVDRFILADEVQYIDKGWINRNRILKPLDDGCVFIIAPILKHHFQTNILDIQVIEGDAWKKRIMGQIAHYKKKSPYYKTVHSLLTDCFAYEDTSITRLNAVYLKNVCDYLGINFKVEIQSEMDFDYSGVTGRDDRPIRMCEQLGAVEYINAPGGKDLYDKSTFAESNIRLSFLQPVIKTYEQQIQNFEPGLSIIDIMMFNSPAAIRDMVNDYQLT